MTELRLMFRASETERARQLDEKLRLLGIAVHPRKIEKDTFLGVFQVLAEGARDQMAGAKVHVNVSCGPRPLGCAALAGSFFHGLQAFEIVEGRPRFFPILALSYSELVGPAKLRLLQAISDNGGTYESLQSLADALRMEKSLLSYHLRGTRKTRGLESLGLVRVEREARGRLKLTLTPVGRFVLAANPTPHGEGPLTVERFERPFRFEARSQQA